MHTARIVFTVIMALVLMGCPPPVSDNPGDPPSEVNDSASAGNTSAQNGDNPAPVRKHHVAYISSGSNHSMILKTDKTLWAVGKNNKGQLGDGSTEQKLSPVQVMEIPPEGGPARAMTNVKQVSSGKSHSMILKNDDTLWAVGNNDYGQLGNNLAEQKLNPVQVMTGIAYISAGVDNTMIFKKDDSLWAVGSNNSGQLGNGSRDNKKNPVQVKIAGGSAMTNVAQISSGPGHTMILKKNDTLWGTGSNFFGQLGDGTNNKKLIPVQVKIAGGTAMTNVAQVSAGGGHSMILKRDDTLWGTGYNANGELGDGTKTNRAFPVQVKTANGEAMTEVAQVSAGMNYSMILKKNGELWAVGLNNKGQLGDGSTTTQLIPVQVMEIPAEGADPRPMTAVAQVSASEFHTMIVKRDGTLWAVGANASGQLGNGGADNFASRLNPEQITPVTGCHDYLP